MSTALGGVIGGVMKSPHAFRAMRTTSKKVTKYEKDVNTPILSDEVDKPYDLVEGTTSTVATLEGSARRILKGRYPQEVKKTILQLVNDSSFFTNLQKTGKGNIMSVTGTMGLHLGHMSEHLFNLQDIHHQFISGRARFNKKHKAPRVPALGIYTGGSGFKGLIRGRSDFDDFIEKVNEYRMVELGNKTFTWKGKKYSGEKLKRAVKMLMKTAMQARRRIFGEDNAPISKKSC